MRAGDLLKELQARDETAEVLVMHQDSNTGVPVIAVEAKDEAVVLMTHTPP